MTEQAESAAAGIEYAFVARPVEVSAEYDAPAGTSLRFLAIKAIDGSRVEAALWQPGDRPVNTTTLVISVHGSGGTFHGHLNGFLAKGLAAKGYGVLGINTRQSGKRVNTDNFLEVRRDIEAAAYTARALSYRTLVLHGHSLGNIQVQFYAATNWEKDIKAVILTGMFGNLPWIRIGRIKPLFSPRAARRDTMLPRRRDRRRTEPAGFLERLNGGVGGKPKSELRAPIGMVRSGDAVAIMDFYAARLEHGGIKVGM